MTSSAGQRRLLLLGGGHAHLEVLRRLAERPLVHGAVTLVSPFPVHHYSSMVPGFVRGVTPERAFAFDLVAACAAAGVTFVRGHARRVDTAQRVVHVQTDDGERCERYDVLSLDIGSAPAASDVPGARKHAYTVRPMARAVALEQRLSVLLAEAGTPLSCVVVGAGAAGVELALALSVRCREASRGGTVTLLDRADGPLPGDHPRARRAVRRILETAGVRLLGGARVTRVTADTLHLDDGRTMPAAFTVWMTGAAPPALFADSPSLGTDEHGWLPVGPTLRAVRHDDVYGAGDCVGFPGRPDVAKAGVYAVHGAPTLAHNLRVAIDGGTARHYVPQRVFLALLDTADGRALFRWRGIVWHARWAKRLKDVIDGRFLARYPRVASPT